eukprot:12359573-Karenia_brevis.AAC.1
MTESELQAMQGHQHEVEQIKQKLAPKTLTTLSGEVAEGLADQPLQERLHESRQKGEGTTLANLSLAPTTDNVCEAPYFMRAIQVILKRSTQW